jgi:hypothetical protein
LTLKGYTKGEHVLRFEAIVHNTRALGCGRVLERFPEIVARLAAMVERFTTMLDCGDIGFLPDGILDELPTASQIGATPGGRGQPQQAPDAQCIGCRHRSGGRPDGFTVADFTAKVHAMTGQSAADYTIRQAAYDLRKLRAKSLVVKPGRSRRYLVPAQAARTITALSVLRDQVIGPLVAGVRVPRQGGPPKAWTRIDRDYEALRVCMQTLFADLGLSRSMSLAA